MIQSSKDPRFLERFEAYWKAYQRPLTKWHRGPCSSSCFCNEDIEFACLSNGNLFNVLPIVERLVQNPPEPKLLLKILCPPLYCLEKISLNSLNYGLLNSYEPSFVVLTPMHELMRLPETVVVAGHIMVLLHHQLRFVLPSPKIT
ncbi:hypothetical protein TSMEX_008706 [Taenia solium]|eukprot:TsM_000129200 transcript=TsM_000129200 gene=TsM_000129200